MKRNKIGLAILNPSHASFDQVCKLSRKDSKILELLAQNNWNFSSFYTFTQYEKIKWEILYQVIKDAYCEHLIFRYDLSEKIYGLIFGPAYINLKVLQISFAQIESIQPLEFLNAPQLNELRLSTNNITNFSPLNKTNFRKLSTINIQNNPIQHCSLNRFRHSTKKEFQLRYSTYYFCAILSQDLNIFSKMQAYQIRYENQTVPRIGQWKIQNVIRSKYAERIK